MFDTLPLLFPAPPALPAGEGTDVAVQASSSGDFAEFLGEAIAEEGESPGTEAEIAALGLPGLPLWIAPMPPQAPVTEAMAVTLKLAPRELAAVAVGPFAAQPETPIVETPPVNDGGAATPAPRAGHAAGIEVEAPIFVDELLARWRGGEAQSPVQRPAPTEPQRPLPSEVLSRGGQGGGADGKALPPAGKPLPSGTTQPMAFADAVGLGAVSRGTEGVAPPAAAGTDVTTPDAAMPDMATRDVAMPDGVGAHVEVPDASELNVKAPRGRVGGVVDQSLPAATPASVEAATASGTPLVQRAAGRGAGAIPASGPRPPPKGQIPLAEAASAETPLARAGGSPERGTIGSEDEPAFGAPSAVTVTETVPAPATSWTRELPGVAATSPQRAEPAAAGAEPAPAQAVSQHIELPLAHPRWAEAMASRVVWFARQEFQHAQLQLSPAELGPIDIALSIHGAEASVAFSAQHASTREALEQSIPRLRELFAQNGVQLGQVDVSAHADKGDKAWQERGGQPGGGPHADPIAKEEPVLRAPPAGPVAAGRIDYFA